MLSDPGCRPWCSETLPVRAMRTSRSGFCAWHRGGDARRGDAVARAITQRQRRVSDGALREMGLSLQRIGVTLRRHMNYRGRRDETMASRQLGLGASSKPKARALLRRPLRREFTV